MRVMLAKSVQRIWVLIAAIMAVPFPVMADTPPNVIELGKRTTAKVYNKYQYEDFDGAYEMDSAGTAICITKSGYFITDEHVVHDLGQVRIVIEKAQHNVRYYYAHVVALEPKLDLAVLKVDNADPFLPLPIATTADIKRGMHVTAIGYPVHGDDITEDTLAWYTASVHGGKVTELIWT